jgi:isopentenyldiphosphate isomerase
MENIKTLPQPIITYKIKYKNKKGKEEKRLEYIFLATIKKDQIIKTQIEEIDEYKFFTAKEIQEINTFEQIKKLTKVLK